MRAGLPFELKVVKILMKKFLIFSMCLFVFMVSCFVFPSPSPLKADGEAYGDTIPPLPSEAVDYDYNVILYYPYADVYRLAVSNSLPIIHRNFRNTPYVCECVLEFQGGSYLRIYDWKPLESDSFVFRSEYSNGAYFSPASGRNTTESEFREMLVYLNFDVYDSNGDLFFLKTPLMTSTIMQKSITGFLQGICLQTIMRTIVPFLVVLLGLLVVCLKVCPRLLKIFTKV